MRIRVEKQLNADKLNVLSDEGFADSCSQDILLSLNRVKQVLSNCDVHILCSLRSPVDFLYSYFVETHQRHFYKQPGRNTFKKFSNLVLNNSDSKEYLMFFYEDLLSLISQYFSHKTILLFEDLTQDEDNYYKTLSHLLSIDKNEIKHKFLVEKQNVKKSNSSGKISSAKASPFVEIYKRIHKTSFLKYCKLLKNTRLKYIWMFFSNFYWKKLMHITYHKHEITHPYPDKNLDSQLFALLRIKNIDTFAKQHKVDKNKLIKYRY